jgi:hypothetical protein
VHISVWADTSQQQYRQCTYNVILRGVYETIVAEEKTLTYICVCARACMHVRSCVCVGVSAQALACACALLASLMQHATCSVCHLAYLALPNLLRFLTKGTVLFRKIVIEYKMCILILCRTFIWNISHSKKNSARYCNKCENVFV